MTLSVSNGAFVGANSSLFDALVLEPTPAPSEMPVDGADLAAAAAMAFFSSWVNATASNAIDDPWTTFPLGAIHSTRYGAPCTIAIRPSGETPHASAGDPSTA